MRVQAPPIRLRCDSLPAHSEQARYLQAEAGNRAQSDIRCGVTLALMGSSYGETEPAKATQDGAGHNENPPTSLETIPAAYFPNSGKSLGNPVVEVATPKGTNNRTGGTNKNELKVKEGSPSK